MVTCFIMVTEGKSEYILILLMIQVEPKFVSAAQRPAKLTAFRPVSRPCSCVSGINQNGTVRRFWQTEQILPATACLLVTGQMCGGQNRPLIKLV